MNGIVWLASYPKSGNTWLRILLANYLRDDSRPADINNILVGPIASSRPRFDEWAGMEGAALDPDTVDRLRPEVYRCLARDAGETLFMKAHDRWRRLGDGQPMFPADVTRGVVYIIRNPLDLAASCAHHWGVPVAQAAGTLCDGPDPARAATVGAPDHLRESLGSWSQHVSSWVDDSGLPLHVLRYEDLSADPDGSFGAVVEFCGLGYDRDRVRKAVEFSSFGELRHQEAAAGFRERSPLASDGFFRRGETGSWRDELPAYLAGRLTATHRQTMDRFGYVC